MAVQIIGAAGFVALNAIEHLLILGRQLVGLDRLLVSERTRRDLAGSDIGTPCCAMS